MPNISNKPMAVAAGFAALAAAIIFFAIIPLISNIREIGRETGRRQVKAADYGRRIAVAREFISFSAREKIGLEQIAGVFADGKMPLDLINTLESAAKNSNVDVDFSLAGQSSPQSIKIGMNISGTVMDILRFIGKMENSPYLAEIENVNIRADKSEEGADRFSGKAAKGYILLNVYAKLPSKQISTAK